MKKIIIPFVVFILFTVTLAAVAAQKVTVEILYMNHGPLLSTLKEIDKVCVQFKDTTTVFRYDFESEDGERFMNKKGVRQHVPLMIWIDGKNAVPVNGKEIKFIGFPTGSGPASFQGKWTIDDLRNALNAATRKK